MFIILFFIPFQAFTSYTKSPKLVIHNDSYKSNYYSITTEEVLNIYYPWAFDITISYYEGVHEANISAFIPVNETALQGKGCVFDQRRTSFESALYVDIPRTDRYFFTDFTVSKQFNKTFLLRNDFQIYEIFYYFNEDGYLETIQTGQFPFNFEKLLCNNIFLKLIENSLLPQIVSNPQIFHDEKNQVGYIFTELGGVSFNATNTEIGESIRPFELKKRQSIYKVLYSNQMQLIFVVAGKEGIDCYLFFPEERKIQYSYTIIIEDQNVNLNLISAQLNGNKTLLFILDDANGIHFAKIFRDYYVYEQKLESFFIPIQNPISFAYQKGSFIVVAKTSQMINYAIEILIDLNSLEYTYNKQVHQILQFKILFRGYVNPRYFLRARPRISSWSGCPQVDFQWHIPRQQVILFDQLGFADKDFDFDVEFFEANLKRIQIVEHFSSIRRGQVFNYLYGLSGGQFKTFLIKDEAPKITCESSGSLVQSYHVTAKLTQCHMKYTANPFELCQIDHTFYLVIDEVLMESDEKNKAILIVCIIGAFIVLLLIIGFLLCRRWSRVIEFMQNEFIALEQKKKYSSMQEQNDELQKI